MVGDNLSVKSVISPGNIWWKDYSLGHFSGTRHKLMIRHDSVAHDIVKQGDSRGNQH